MGRHPNEHLLVLVGLSVLYISGITPIALGCSMALWVAWCYRQDDPTSLIPGPPALPVVGNVHQIDMLKVHQQCALWAAQFGPVLRLQIFHDNLIILNDIDTIKEAMLGTKGKDFAGRPKMFRAMVSQYEQQDLAFQDYCPQVERLRNIVHKSITKGKDGVAFTSLENVVKVELHEIIEVFAAYEGQEFDPREDISTYLCNIIATIIFGRRFEKDSAQLRLLFQMNRLYVDTYNPARGAELDIFTWLRFFGHPVYRDLLKAIKIRNNILEKLIADHEAHTDLSAPSCLLDLLLVEMERDKLDPPKRGEGITHDNVKATTLDLVIAGVVRYIFVGKLTDFQETTTTAIYSLLGLLLSHPHVMKKLQEEVDRVLGKRDANFGNQDAMPYYQAVVFEHLRYVSINPLSLPHSTMRDTTVGGYFVPAGTQVFPNFWAVHHNPEIYENPYTFNPERWLHRVEQNYELVPLTHPVRANFLAFGLGKRECIGESLGRHRMFLFLTTLLQHFNVHATQDLPSSDSRQYPLQLIIRPPDFKIRLSHRI